MKNLADLADFLAKLPKRNAFLAKRSETFFVVSRNWSETKRNCFCFAKFRFEAKLFLKRNWDTLSLTRIQRRKWKRRIKEGRICYSRTIWTCGIGGATPPSPLQLTRRFYPEIKTCWYWNKLLKQVSTTFFSSRHYVDIWKWISPWVGDFR